MKVIDVPSHGSGNPSQKPTLNRFTVNYAVHVALSPAGTWPMAQLDTKNQEFVISWKYKGSEERIQGHVNSVSMKVWSSDSTCVRLPCLSPPHTHMHARAPLV